jgi:hypothetical protein
MDLSEFRALEIYLFIATDIRSCRYMGGYMILTIGGMPTGKMWLYFNTEPGLY